MSSPTAPSVEWLSQNEMLAWRSYVETNADLMAALERDLAVRAPVPGRRALHLGLGRQLDELRGHSGRARITSRTVERGWYLYATAAFS